MSDLFPSSGESPHADSGELNSGEVARPVETKGIPPFTEQRWEAPSKVSRMIQDGITITLRITPYLITAWIFAPDEVRYELRKQVRWIPWAVKYAVWWLKQEGY